MSKFMELEIDNSKKSSIASGGWSDPGAKLYDQLLQSYYYVGGVPTDGRSMERAIKEGKYKQWYDFLEEAYLIAPIKDIKNSPYEVTPYTRSGCKYPHHVIKNGKLVVSIPGIKAAYARAKQAGIFKGKVKEHLERHYKEMGIYQGSTMQINEKIEQNFDLIEGYIFEATGIDLHCPATLFSEDVSDVYDPPLSFDKLPEHLKNDPIHAWRAQTGIELIHKEPTIEEFNRIWDNWNKMSDEQKSISDQKSMELFGKNNHDHYMELIKEYNKTNDHPAISIFPDKKYTMEDIPNIMYFSSPTKVTELKGRVFLTPYIGISSIFTIDRFHVLKDYARKMLVAKQVFLNANIGYDEWGLPNSKLLKPLSLVHMTHNIKDLPGVAKGTSTGYIYTVDISDIDKDQLSMFVTMDPDREIIYKGDKPLNIIHVQEHTANWELRFDPENMARHGVGTVKIAESYSSIDELKKEYCTERSDNMDEDDDLKWITEYLMEDAEPKNASDNEKYNITHRKSKYKGWVEYIVHSKDGKEAASCIINEKTGDCANVETKPEYRRQGYMQYLLKYLIKFKGVKYAQVQQDNSIAISLYRKIGFEVEFKYTDKEKGPMYSMSFQGDVSKLIVEGYNFFTEAEEPPSMPGDKAASTEEQKEEPEKESMPKKTDKAESSKNGVRRKKLYIAFIEWCKEYNPKNTFGSIFDKDAFNVSYPFVPEEMRYFYRLANPMLCVLGGELTFFAASELRKLNSKNSHLNEMMIFAATPNDLRVFNVKDKKIYRGTEENGAIKLNEVIGDTFDTYIQKMINKGDILNAPLEESTDFE